MESTSQVYICYHTDDEPVVAHIKEALTAAGITFKTSPMSPPFVDPSDLPKRTVRKMQKRGELTTDGWYTATPLLPPENKEEILSQNILLSIPGRRVSLNGFLRWWRRR